MLVLSRRIGESLILNDDVKIAILGIKGNQIRLGVNAPKDVTVHREEIYLKIKKEGLNPTLKLKSDILKTDIKY